MKIAIVGSGISGLSAARALAPAHDDEVFEAGDHAGGHTHTHTLRLDGREVRIDSGFIVFNERTYPGFCALLRELGVGWQASDMGLSVRCAASGLEYNGRNLDTLFAQRSNLLRPSFHRLLLQIVRFHREARALLEHDGPDRELSAWLGDRRYSAEFRAQFLEPMVAAIWSAPAADVGRIPVRFLARFLSNHGMLQVEGRPQWLTVRGGSRAYVDALLAQLRARVHLRTPVTRIERHADRVELVLAGGERRAFDHVVLATHADQSLALLERPTATEHAVLGALRYQPNDAVLHTDPRFMPRRARCWASWNCHVEPATDARSRGVGVTYWMNRLQALDLETQVFVTLNRADEIDPSRVLARMRYDHPRFDLAAIDAQARRGRIQGRARTWFCGAYWGFGFHEYGLQSGLSAAQALLAAREPVEVRA
jgi:predicted NAD/FAD-binding protein